MRDLDGGIDDNDDEGTGAELEEKGEPTLREVPQDQEVEIIEAPEEDVQAKEKDDEDEPLSKSKAVKKRIERERKLWQGRVNDKDLEIQSLQAKLAQVERDKSDESLAAIDGNIELTRASLRAAKESGDSDKEIEFTEKLTDLRAEKIVRARTQQQSPAQIQAGPERQPRNEAKDEWLSENDWFDQAGRETDSAIVRAVDQEIFAAGLDPNSKEYFDELNKRLAKRGIKAKALAAEEDDDDPAPPPRKQVVSDGRPSAPTGNGGKVTITSAQADQMRMFKLDPRNPQHVRRWLSEAKQNG